MKKLPEVGTEFIYQGSVYRRETDDPEPDFPSATMRVTHISQPDYPPKDWQSYTFAAEPEWFHQRKFEGYEITDV